MTYTTEDCYEAIADVNSNIEGNLSRRQYDENRNDNQPSASSITYNCESWNKAKQKAEAEIITRSKSVNEQYFDEVDTTEKAYWLGMMTGDGSVYYNQNDKLTMKLALHEKDSRLVERFSDDIDSEHDICYTDETAKIAITNQEFVSHLMKWGVTPDKTHSGGLPELHDSSLRRAFVRGLSDADGSFPDTEYSNKWDIAQSNITRLEGIRRWIPAPFYIHEGSNAAHLSLKEPKKNIDLVVQYLYPEGENTEPAMERKRTIALER